VCARFADPPEKRVTFDVCKAHAFESAGTQACISLRLLLPNQPTSVVKNQSKTMGKAVRKLIRILNQLPTCPAISGAVPWTASMSARPSLPMLPLHQRQSFRCEDFRLFKLHNLRHKKQTLRCQVFRLSRGHGFLRRQMRPVFALRGQHMIDASKAKT
jgi:hypothetical protein